MTAQQIMDSGELEMNIVKTILATAFAATAFSAPTLAQDAKFQLPEQCSTATAAGGMDNSTMGQGGMDGNQGGGMDGNQAGGMGSSMGGNQGGSMSGGMGDGMMGMMGMMGMGGMDLESMPEHVQENMRRMMETMPAMHKGMMNEDADVAFACGMIAHHQGAIDMAEVLLENGDDPQMRALAEEIIAAQVGEIEQMTTWLAENAN
ncbi:CopM family metallochaperone [Paracoccus sediminis]|nr:DUF305 domain-containing protein [Paracoccus sediminis]